MYLAAVEIGVGESTEISQTGSCKPRWHDWPFSTISHHGQPCCEIAREWVLATDFSQLGDAAALTGPRWLRQKYPWGPSPWPLHWCEAVESERLDCGAHAAISHQLFTARGVTSFPAQFVQQFGTDATQHWADRWEEGSIASAWIDGGHIYHEGCAILVSRDEIKLWDASAGWWINPRQFDGYGALLRVRVAGLPGSTFRWGDRPIRAAVWEPVQALL